MSYVLNHTLTYKSVRDFVIINNGQRNNYAVSKVVLSAATNHVFADCIWSKDKSPCYNPDVLIHFHVPEQLIMEINVDKFVSLPHSYSFVHC